MTEQADIAAQLEASMSAVHGAFARVKQAVSDNDALSALEGMADAIPALAGFAGAATQAVEVVGQQRDAARAELAKLQEAFEKSAVYTAHLQVTRQDALAEVAKLQAEVAKLRGQLPTWKRGSYGRSLWSIGVPNARKKLQVWRYDSRWFWAFLDGHEQPATDRDAAMRAAEAAADLPQCEVCDE